MRDAEAHQASSPNTQIVPVAVAVAVAVVGAVAVVLLVVIPEGDLLLQLLLQWQLLAILTLSEAEGEASPHFAHTATTLSGKPLFQPDILRPKDKPSPTPPPSSHNPAPSASSTHLQPSHSASRGRDHCSSSPHPLESPPVSPQNPLHETSYASRYPRCS